MNRKDCIYWMQGSCKRGDTCRFRHDPSKRSINQPPCIFFAQGRCNKGSSCRFRHVLAQQSFSFPRSVCSQSQFHPQPQSAAAAWDMLSGRGGAAVNAKGAVVLLEGRVKDKDSEAMWMLGVCCEFGIGIEQDIERASMLYGQSKEGGNVIGENLAENGKVNERGSGYLRINSL